MPSSSRSAWSVGAPVPIRSISRPRSARSVRAPSQSAARRRFEIGDPRVVVLEPAEARREPAQREPLARVDPALELGALAAREPGWPRDSRSESSARPSFSQ
jgi:hypothetical protein